MPVFKNESNGTWYVMARYVNWKGERKQKCKRGFSTKKEAQEWERMFQLQNSSDMDMSFEAFTELYIRDMKSRLKENTWLTKEHIIRTIVTMLGHFKNFFEKWRKRRGSTRRPANSIRLFHCPHLFC